MEAPDQKILCFPALPIPDFSRWREESSRNPSPHWAKVTTDTGDARSITLWLRACPPYRPTREGVALSSFYIASNALHAQTRERALNLPLKPLLAGYGIGAYGRNGPIAVPGLGTRFAAAAEASSDPPDPLRKWDDHRPLDARCEKCGACAAACPNGALPGNGRVDVALCLRAQAQFQTPRMPDASRDRIGASQWGCDLCQEACPRNAAIAPVSMPEELERALELKRLLAGDVKPLGEWIGTNYARPARMQARASLVAANLGRRDLTEDIRKLQNSPVEAVRDCAAWALVKLER